MQGMDELKYHSQLSIQERQAQRELIYWEIDEDIRGKVHQECELWIVLCQNCDEDKDIRRFTVFGKLRQSQ